MTKELREELYWENQVIQRLIKIEAKLDRVLEYNSSNAKLEGKK